MTTKALRTIAGMMGCSGVPEKCLHCGATRELEAIEKAAKDYKFRKSIESIEALEEVLSDIARDAP